MNRLPISTPSRSTSPYEIRDVWEQGYEKIAAIGDVHAGFDELVTLLREHSNKLNRRKYRLSNTNGHAKIQSYT